MPERNLTKPLMEQMAPIIETMFGRIETDLTDRDKAAIGHALIEAGLFRALALSA